MSAQPKPPPPLLTARVQLAAGARVKRHADGSVDYASPLPLPFAYGEVEGTLGGDGMALDAVILGARPPAGALVTLPLQGAVAFVDGGLDDLKLVLARRAPSAVGRAALLAFFAALATAKTLRALLRGGSGASVGGWLDAEAAAARLGRAVTPPPGLR